MVVRSVSFYMGVWCAVHSYTRARWSRDALRSRRGGAGELAHQLSSWNMVESIMGRRQDTSPLPSGVGVEWGRCGTGTRTYCTHREVGGMDRFRAFLYPVLCFKPVRSVRLG